MGACTKVVSNNFLVLTLCSKYICLFLKQNFAEYCVRNIKKVFTARNHSEKFWTRIVLKELLINYKIVSNGNNKLSE